MIRGPLDSKAMAVEATIIPPGRDKLSPVIVIVNGQIISRRVSFNIILQNLV